MNGNAREGMQRKGKKGKKKLKINERKIKGILQGYRFQY